MASHKRRRCHHWKLHWFCSGEQEARERITFMQKTLKYNYRVNISFRNAIFLCNILNGHSMMISTRALPKKRAVVWMRKAQVTVCLNAQQELTILSDGKSLPYTVITNRPGRLRSFLPNSLTSLLRKSACLPDLLPIIPGAKALPSRSPNLEMSPLPNVKFLLSKTGDILTLG